MIPKTRLASAIALVLLLAAAPTANAQYGRGLPRYRDGLSGPYQFGFGKTYELVVVNASLQDLEFRMTRIKDELQQWGSPTAEWIIPAGRYGTLKTMALDVEGTFYTRRGVKVPAEPRFGDRFATFYVDEDVIRRYESRDPEGAVVIRTPDARTNPNIKERPTTTLSKKTRFLLRGLKLLKGPSEYPGGEKFREFRSGGFSQDFDKALSIRELELGGVANSGRIRQPGERPLVVEILRSKGEIPRGFRFSARIGHELAHRTETGELDGNGVVRLFVAPVKNVSVDFTISPPAGFSEYDFSIDPTLSDRFKIRIP